MSDPLPEWVPLNWVIISNPVNWMIIILMVLLGSIILCLLMGGLGIANTTYTE